MDEQKADEWLFEVEEVFDTHIGLIVSCSPPHSGAAVHIGDALLFVCPDGHKVAAHIEYFPLVSAELSRRSSLLSLLKTDETKQITAGAQAFRRSPDSYARESKAAS